MTPDQRFALIISGLGLVFAMLTAVARLLWRAGQNVGRILTEVQSNSQEIKTLAESVSSHYRWHLGPPGQPRR